MTVGSLLSKTYAFVFLRLAVIIVTLGSYLLVSVWVADYLVNLFEINLVQSKFIYYLFYLNYLWIGFSIGMALYLLVRKTLLFYVKAAHVIALTRVCTDDIPALSLTLASLNDMRVRFLSVNLFYMADSLATKAMEEVGELLLQQEIPALMDKNKDGKVSEAERKQFHNNIFIKAISSVIKKALSYSDELILSHVFLRSRIEEKFGEDEEQKGGKKSRVKKILGWVSDGISLYFKNCIPLAKKSFLLVVSATAFSVIITVLTLVLLWLFQVPLVKASVIFFVVRIVWVVIEYVLLEPYELAGMMLSYYDVLCEEPTEGALDSVKAYLAGKSKYFKDLLEVATESVVSGGGNSPIDGVDANDFIPNPVKGSEEKPK